MLLAIDVGNTNTVLGLYRLATRGDTLPPRSLADWRVTTHRSLTVDEVGIIFRDLFALRSLDMAQVTGVIVSSVVPPLDSTLRRAIELYFRVKPLFVEPGIRTGLPILTDNPSEVGADRIVNCVAAIELFRQPGQQSPRTNPPHHRRRLRHRHHLRRRQPAKASTSAEPSPPASASPPTRSSPAPPACPASTSASPPRSSAPAPSTTSRSASTTATSAWSTASSNA